MAKFQEKDDAEQREKKHPTKISTFSVLKRGGKKGNAFEITSTFQIKGIVCEDD